MKDERLVCWREREIVAEDPNVSNARLDLVQCKRAHRTDRKGEDFGVRKQRIATDDLGVQLEELAVPSLLRLFVPEHIARAEQLERLRPTAKIGDVEPQD